MIDSPRAVTTFSFKKEGSGIIKKSRTWQTFAEVHPYHNTHREKA
jgi:hypothetical protein